MSKKPEANTPQAVLVKTLAEFHELVRLYQVAVSIQYDRKQRGSSGGGSSKGTYSDPTASMGTSSSASGSVRNNVRLVDDEVQRLHDRVQRLVNLLGDSIDRWDS